jgi:acetylornithine/N-succinyldiaminopimelate aminotransferase
MIMEGIIEDIIHRESRALIQFFKRQRVVFERGQGCWLYDVNGRKYLDLVAGIACVILGHSHPYFVKRISEQLSRLIHVSNLYYTVPQIELAERLGKITGMDRFFFCNSGTEAVEAALKIARRVTGRKKFVAFSNAFHGRTMGALSVTYKEKFRKPFEPLVQPVEFSKYNSVENLGKVVDDETAAVIIEPVQGEAGVYPAEQRFIDEIFRLREKYNYLVIFDEIQTGFGRTGRWFAKEHFGADGVEPDIITLAKGMGNGFPVGGVGVTDEVAEKVEAGDHGSTFGGNPLACVAALATIEVIEKEKLVENSARMGERFKEGLSLLGLKSRGLGLMIGFEVENAPEFVSKCLEAGVVVNSTSDTTIRLLPPLTISEEEVDHALRVFSDIL